MWFFLALLASSAPPTEDQRPLLFGMQQVVERLPEVVYDPKDERFDVQSMDDGSIDLTYTYAPDHKRGTIDWMYHSVLVRHVIPRNLMAGDDLAEAARALARTRGYPLEAMATPPLLWTTHTQCYLLRRKGISDGVGTLCVGSRDRALVFFAVEGLVLREEGSVDALLSSTLDALLRFRP